MTDQQDRAPSGAGRETAEEFEWGYAERAGLTVEELRELGRGVRPCDCDEDICTGWKMVSIREEAWERQMLANQS